jgi:hypothetical protein
MTYRTVATASAIVSVVYGLAALLVPNALASLFGVAMDTLAEYEGRLLGGAYLGYALVNFLTKDTADPLTRRAIAAANAVAWAVGLVVLTLGQLQGLSNAIAWTSVVVALVFTVVWAWTYAAERGPGAAAKGLPVRP